MAGDPIVRRFFARITRCPHCLERGHRGLGHNEEGTIQYRRCIHCESTYKVTAIAIEVDRGLPSSVIVLPGDSR